MDSDSYSSSETPHSRNEEEEAFIAYESELANDENEISNWTIDIEENNWNNVCRYGFIFDKVKKTVVNQRLKNTHSVIINLIKHYMMLTYETLWKSNQ